MMNNPVKPIPCEIIDIKKESLLEYTFKVKPQPSDHEDSGFDTISRIIDVFG